jgi:hypothetical protein
MAIEETSLGLRKPDGNELLRNGDNVIAYNAEVTDGLLVNADFRLASIEALAEPPALPSLRPSNLALAPDGIPYILPGADEIRVYAGTDGSYYFTT